MKTIIIVALFFFFTTSSFSQTTVLSEKPIKNEYACLTLRYVALTEIMDNKKIKENENGESIGIDAIKSAVINAGYYLLDQSTVNTMARNSFNYPAQIGEKFLLMSNDSKVIAKTLSNQEIVYQYSSVYGLSKAHYNKKIILVAEPVYN